MPPRAPIGNIFLPGKTDDATSVATSMRTLERQTLNASHPFKFSVYAATAQSIPNATFTTLAIDTVWRDPNSMLKASSNLVVIRQSGWWNMVGSLTFNNPAVTLTNVLIQISVQRVGTTVTHVVKRGTQVTSGTLNCSVAVMANEEFLAGDQVWLTVYQANTTSVAQAIYIDPTDPQAFNSFTGHLESFPVR